MENVEVKLNWIKETIDTLNNINSTSFRISFTYVFLIGGTAIKYWWTGVAPADSWLMFLGGMSGIDAAQFVGKRFSFKPEASRGNGQNVTTPEEGEASTDIQELVNKNKIG